MKIMFMILTVLVVLGLVVDVNLATAAPYNGSGNAQHLHDWLMAEGHLDNVSSDDLEFILEDYYTKPEINEKFEDVYDYIDSLDLTGAQGEKGDKGDKGDAGIVDYTEVNNYIKDELDGHQHNGLEALESLLMGNGYSENGHSHDTNPNHDGLAENVQDKFDKADGAFQRENITNINDSDFDINEWAANVLNNDANNLSPRVPGSDMTIYDTETIDAMFSLATANALAAFADPIDNLNSRIDSMQNFVDDMNKELSAGVASASALTGIDNHLDKTSRYSAGISGGYYNGQGAIAAGAVIRTSHASALNFGISLDTYQAKPAMRLGWNVQW